MSEKRDRIPDDLIPVAQQLSASRPTLTPEQLALARERVGSRAQPSWGPRLTLTTMLVLGIVLSTTGAGLAISGLARDGSAGKAQYRAPGGETPTVQTPTGETPTGETPTGETPTGDVLPEDLADEDQPQVLDETNQVLAQTEATADEGDLPFTGLAAIPLILAGGTLLILGIGLRRRAQPD